MLMISYMILSKMWPCIPFYHTSLSLMHFFFLLAFILCHIDLDNPLGYEPKNSLFFGCPWNIAIPCLL